MINITEKSNCCGCCACGDKCPKQAISFKTDAEGFWYPEVVNEKCIDCHLCEKVCPLLNLNQFQSKEPKTSFYAINNNEVERDNSSSGGIFIMLMKKTIKEGGVVFGATYDEEWMVHHTSADDLQDALKFQGSKYVQSKAEGCYNDVWKELKDGRRVLFAGTACQIAALKCFLDKEYDNLVTIDVVCHGVPSPGIWRNYLSELKTNKEIIAINFRDKSTGWRNYSLTVHFSDGSELKESHYKNLYMQGFLHDLYLRPSCHNCKFKEGKCGSDITLGDFWGIEKVRSEVDDDQGVSLVLANTPKGDHLIKTITPTIAEVSYSQAVQGNACIVRCTPENKWRKAFWEHYQNEGLVKSVKYVVQCQKPSLLKKVVVRIKNVLMPQG